MKDEIGKARAQHRFYSIPTRERPDEPPVTLQETTARRRSLRMVTDSLIHTAMLNGDAAQLLEALVETMTAVGGTCAQFGVEPTISDFLLAGKDLVEDARTLLDRAVNVREYDQVAIGASMMECVCVGIAAILGLPYREALAMAHGKYMNAERPAREDWEVVLRAAGFKLDGGAANDD